MSMMSEFREFIAKGNVMDLAVGVIIGVAFQKIVDSLGSGGCRQPDVADVMPAVPRVEL